MPFTITGNLFHKVSSVEYLSLQCSPDLCVKIDSLVRSVEFSEARGIDR